MKILHDMRAYERTLCDKKRCRWNAYPARDTSWKIGVFPGPRLRNSNWVGNGQPLWKVSTCVSTVFGNFGSISMNRMIKLYVGWLKVGSAEEDPGK